MSKSIWIIRDEHQKYASVLNLMRSLVKEAHNDRMAADVELMSSILTYVEEFIDTYHHPKEDDYLFKALRKRCPQADSIIQELEADHHKGEELLRDLKAKLEAFAQTRSKAGLDEFAKAVHAYVDFESSHAIKEDREILPLAESHLTSDDWAEIDNAFMGNIDPLFGDERKAEFNALFHAIAEQAPAPYGYKPT